MEVAFITTQEGEGKQGDDDRGQRLPHQPLLRICGKTGEAGAETPSHPRQYYSRLTKGVAYCAAGHTALVSTAFCGLNVTWGGGSARARYSAWSPSSLPEVVLFSCPKIIKSTNLMVV